MDLSGTWRFRPGDDPAWASPEFDDSSWAPLRVPSHWEPQGFVGYNGFGWYRKRFTVPEAWRRRRLLLRLGRVDDDDVTYFNGVKVGETKGVGSIRHYLVPPDIVNFGAENVIAVRVWDGAMGGGMIGHVTLKVAEAADFLQLRAEPLPTDPEAGRGGARVFVKNTWAEPLKARIVISARDHFGVEVARLERDLTLRPGEEKEVEVPFSVSVPRHYRLEASLRIPRFEPSTVNLYVLPDCLKGPRKRIWLNGDWEVLPVEGEFSFPPQGEWRKFTVPHPERASPFAKFKVHKCWYRRRFFVPDSLRVGRAFLRFEAVMFKASFYLNGRKLGEHVEGYTPFEFDVTDIVKFGDWNELLVAAEDMASIVKPEALKRAEEGRFPPGSVLWPSYVEQVWNGGIWGDVSLLSRPEVYIERVKVFTSVRKRRLTVAARVVNASKGPIEVAVTNAVLDGRKAVLRLPAVSVRLGPGEGRWVVSSSRWEKPQLWFPHSPKLYRLTTRLFVEGRLLDDLHTRFGFREVWIEGPNIVLNGRTAKFRRASYMWHWSWGTRDSLRRYLEGQKAMGFNLIRFHGSPCLEFALDIADEVGMPVVNEGAFYCSGAYAMEEDAFWRHLREHWRGLVVRDFNHPSLLMFSIENEILHCGHQRRVPDLPERLYKIGAFVKRLDPTRIVQFDADFDVNGKVETVNIHYPYQVRSHTSFPNDAFWLLSEKPVKTDTYKGVWMWDRKKPLLVGEFCWDATCNPPFGLTQFIGDRAYVGADWIEGHKAALKMLCDAYRYCGASVLNPWYFRADRWELMPPQHVMLLDWNGTFFSGEKVKRRLVVFNDLLRQARLRVVWRLLRAGAVAARGEKALDMEAGEMREFPVEVRIPHVAERTDLTFEVALLSGGRKVDEIRRKWAALPRGRLKAPEGLRVLVYDPKGRLKGALSRLGLKFAELRSLRGLAVPSGGRAALIVGPARLEEAEGRAISKFVEQGGTALLIEQEEAPKGLPVPLSLDKSYKTCMAHPAAPAHPLLRGLSADDLKFWRDDNVVCRSAYLKPLKGNFAVIVHSGGGPGLRWAPLLEVRHGEGRLLLCQLLVCEKLPSEPVARRLIQNFLDYAASPPPAFRRTVAVGGDPVLIGALEALDVEFEATSAEGLESLGDPSRLLLIVSGRKAPFEGLPSTLLSLAERGATVLVHCLGPDTARLFWPLLPAGARLLEVDLSSATRVGWPPLLWGLSNEEFHWRRGRWRDLRDETEPLAKLAEFALYDAGRPLLSPPVLVEVSVGKGRVLFDQILWDEALERAPQLASRVASQLLSNLGAKIGRRRPGLAFEPLDISPFANASLETDLTGDTGRLAWSEKGENDLSALGEGLKVLGGVPFDVRGLVVLRSPRHAKGMPRSVKIPVGKAARQILFLHGCAWEAPEGTKVAEYIVNLADGSRFEVPVIYGLNVVNWWQEWPRQLPGADLAWVGRNPLHEPLCLYVLRWRNPRPDVAVESVELVSAESDAFPFVLAVTLGR